MTSKFTAYYVIFSLLLIAHVSHAFNLKSLLFGETNQDNSHTSASAPFGTPTTNHPRSSRSDIPCAKYLCEETQDCVDQPIDCPCRLTTDKKCIVRDWYTCIRGDKSCDEL